MRRMRLALLCQLVMAIGLLGATCVVVTGQRGSTGPWVGEVYNGTQQPIARAWAGGQILDANGAVVQSFFQAPTCPAYLLPGERGTFEVFTASNMQGTLPFRIRAEKRIGGWPDPPDWEPRYQSDGLGVRLLYKNATRRLVVAEVENDSNFTYRFVDMCANLRDGSGRLLELAGVDPFNMPIVELAPGERRIFPLLFNDLPEGDIEFVARGIVVHKNGTPSAAFDGITIEKSEEVVDESGQRVLRVVGQIDVSAWPDIGGLRLSAHLDGNYGERVDGVQAGCNTLADAALPAPVQFAIPLDESALLRRVVVETILGTPGQNLHRLGVSGVTHSAGVGTSQVVSARISNTNDAGARLLGVCLLLRDPSGHLAGATSLKPVQYLEPGQSIEVSGTVVPVGKVVSAEAVAFAHVPSTPGPY